MIAPLTPQQDIEKKNHYIVLDSSLKQPMIKSAVPSKANSYFTIPDSKIPSVTEHDINYSYCHVLSFLITHSISGFFFGYQISIMNNLVNPIVQHGMSITNTEDISSAIGNINLFFGLGKMIGSA